ncbi:MAG: hypothetical protein ABI972_20915 [Acidobacteriota bacterium]
MLARPQLAILALLLTVTPTFAGKKLKVTIIEREGTQSSYTGVIPGRTTAVSNGSANCTANGNSANCYGTSTTRQVSTPARRVGYDVQGATFSLLLPDGRVAVVNCESKYAMRGDYVNRRSCRVPLTNEIEAEFNGDKAKLRWTVSIDGKKTESETYKVLAVFDKQ